MASTTIIQATESFSFVGPHGPVSIGKGETFHKEARRLEGVSDEARERNFKPFSPNHDLETATAAPGEKRRGRRTAKSAEETAGDKKADDDAQSTEESKDAEETAGDKK